MRLANPREVAVRILQGRLDRVEPLQILFESHHFRSLESRDRRFVRALVDGVFRNLRSIDFQLRHLSVRSLERLDSEVLWILRTGLFELSYLRTPPYAAVNEATRLCRSFKKRSAAGFVNAVLRKFLSSTPPLPNDSSAESLAIRFSHPDWLVKRYLSRYPLDQVEQILKLNNQVPESILWVNPFRTSLEDFCHLLEREGISYRQLPELDGAIQLNEPGFHRHKFYREGLCFFMDRSSQRVAWLADLQRSELIGDFCAAPGGKTFVMASRMPATARIVAADLHAQRLRVMRRRASLLKVSGVEYVQADLKSAAPFVGRFDHVLLDVPCSGLGTIRSNPDLRWLVKEEDLPRHHVRQVRLLRNGFDALKRRGLLIYATCSTEPEENESVVEEFLGGRSDARVDGPYLRTFPVAGETGDGFFAARVRRL